MRLSTGRDAELLDTARRIATRAHAGQVDKSGAEYITHPARVAGRLTEARAQAVAWLHDVLEDTDVTRDDLLAAAIPVDVVTAVEALTRLHGDVGDQYYARVAANPLALQVKWADIADNTDPERQARLDEATRRRLQAKYAHASEVLRRLSR